jgi:hypothetical protein
MDVETHWNSTLEWVELSYRLREFTPKWIQNTKDGDSRPLFITEDNWTIVQSVMKVWRPFRYWTLWMSKWHTIRLRQVLTVY